MLYFQGISSDKVEIFMYNQKEQAEFDNIFFNKEDKETYFIYKHVNCFDKINVNTISGKDIAISEDKLREVFET